MNACCRKMRAKLCLRVLWQILWTLRSSSGKIPRRRSGSSPIPCLQRMLVQRSTTHEFSPACTAADVGVVQEIEQFVKDDVYVHNKLVSDW